MLSARYDVTRGFLHVYLFVQFSIEKSCDCIPFDEQACCFVVHTQAEYVSTRIEQQMRMFHRSQLHTVISIALGHRSTFEPFLLAVTGEFDFELPLISNCITVLGQLHKLPCLILQY